jgi:hypothetical protein
MTHAALSTAASESHASFSSIGGNGESTESITEGLEQRVSEVK